MTTDDIYHLVDQLKAQHNDDYGSILDILIDIVGSDLHGSYQTIRSLEDTIAMKDRRIVQLEDQNRRFSEKIRHLEYLQF